MQDRVARWFLLLHENGHFEQLRTGRITCAPVPNFSMRFLRSKDPFAFNHVSLYPVPFSINLAESLNSNATDGAIIIIAVRLRKTPKKVKNVESASFHVVFIIFNSR
jgi:hypothetical protein